MPRLVEKDENYFSLRKIRRDRQKKRRAKGIVVVSVEVTEKMRARLGLKDVGSKDQIAAAICKLLNGTAQ